jgi:hypothetical protein
LIAPITIGMALTVRSDIETYNTLAVVYISLFFVFQSIITTFLRYVVLSMETLITETNARVAGNLMVNHKDAQNAQLLKRLKYFRMVMYGTALSLPPLPVVLPAVYFYLGSFPFFYVLVFALFSLIALVIQPSSLYLMFAQKIPSTSSPSSPLKSSRFSRKGRAHAALTQ